MAIILGVFLSIRANKQKILKSLNFTLYEVAIPQTNSQQKPGAFKEHVSIMKQFYSGMVALNSYFVLELGLPFLGDEIVFYAAIPNEKRGVFEKQTESLFPNIKIEVKKEDYNVFKPHGVSLGAVMHLKKNNILPLKTCDKFESDPMQTIINSFSKLKKEGEGASLQLVIKPSGEKITRKIKSVIKKISEGEDFSKITDSEKDFLGSISGILLDMFTGSPKPKSLEEKSFASVDEDLISLLKTKAASKIMLVNMRLIASSETRDKAMSILDELQGSFLQFEETQGNSMDFTVVTRNKLKELLHKFSFRIPDNNNFVSLNIDELASIFHFPSEINSSLAPQLKYASTKTAPAPLDLPNEGLLLGKNLYRGSKKDVYTKDEDRNRHFYVIGQTGTGKSVLLKNMITQDIENGKGVCFIDPHGSDLEDILTRIPSHRVNDVIYFDPSDTVRPMGLNMLEYDPRYPEQKTFVVNEIIGIFNKLFDMKTAGGPMFEQYFRNAAMLVLDDVDSGNTLFEISRVLSDKAFREHKLSLSNNPVVKSFWKDVAEKAGGEASLQNMVPYITSKFDTFLTNEVMRPIIGQEKSSFNFRQIMDENKILLVNLSKGKLGEINSNLLGLILVGKLLMASLSRADIMEEQRNNFYLYIDEFHNITTDSVASILSEARKYKLNLIIAHQYIGQLEENIRKAIFGNVGSMCVFRVGSEDGEFLEKQFDPVFDAHDLINIDNYNAYIKLLINGHTSRPFNIKMNAFEKSSTSLSTEIKKLSSLSYGRTREEIEREINKKYSAKGGSASG